MGGEIVEIQHFGWQPVLQMMCETALCDAAFLVYFPLMLECPLYTTGKRKIFFSFVYGRIV